MGTGIIKVGSVVLENVLYTPTFYRNLVSGTQLMKEGYKAELQNNNLELSKNGTILLAKTKTV